MAKHKHRIALGDASKQPFHNPFASLSDGDAVPRMPDDAEPAQHSQAKSPEPLEKLLFKVRPTLRVERKGHGGKTVTLLGCPAHLTDEVLREIVARLKRGLGCGVTMQTQNEARVLILQGDQIDRVRKLWDEMSGKNAR